MKLSRSKWGLWALVAVLSISSLTFVACAGTWQNSAKATIVTMTDTWDFTMTALGVVYKSGGMSENDKHRAIALGEQVRLSLNAAATAVSVGNSADYNAQVLAISALILQLNQILAPKKGELDYGPGTLAAPDRARAELSAIRLGHPWDNVWSGDFGRTVESHTYQVAKEQRRLFRADARN